MKLYRIVKSSPITVGNTLNGQVADIVLKADSFEKALLSYGANDPKLYYRSRGVNMYRDKYNWIYLVTDVTKEVASHE